MSKYNRYHVAVLMAVAGAGMIVAPGFGETADWSVVPGKRIGHVKIGADAKTLEKLGTANTGEAAMQKAWSTWFTKPKETKPGALPAELDVYTVPGAGEQNTHRVIDKVRATSSLFKLSNGIGAGSSFERIRRAYPDVKLTSTYSTQKSNGPIQIYDDVKRGIAFEIYRGVDGKATTGECSAIIVHRPGTDAAGGYMTLSGYLQGIANTKASHP